jgi:glycine hydroxymethyltransferase
MSIEGFDDELFAAIGDEERRQEEHIELIASENYASRGAAGPGLGAHQQVCRGLSGQALLRRLRVRRRAEELAIERAKALFGADYANVQPHSGSQANAAVFQALLSAPATRSWA